ALILVASFVRGPVRWLPRAVVLPSVLARLAASRFLIRETLVGRDAPQALVTAVCDAGRSVPPAVLAARVRTVLAGDARADLARCTCPLLYLAGDRDRLVHERMIDEIRGLRPDVVVERIAAPHLVLQCNPAAAARAIERFLEPRKKIDPSVSDC